VVLDCVAVFISCGLEDCARFKDVAGRIIEYLMAAAPNDLAFSHSPLWADRQTGNDVALPTLALGFAWIVEGHVALRPRLGLGRRR